MRKRHLFHILPLSPWPILSGLSALFLVSGLAFYMHKVAFGGYLLIFGLICISFCAFMWFSDVVDEATFSGFHTNQFASDYVWDFYYSLFQNYVIFWFFLSLLSCSFMSGCWNCSIFPPEGIFTIPVFEFPLFNTFVLIFSGFSVTWAHRAVSLGLYKEAMDSLLLTIFLGFFLLYCKCLNIMRRLLIIPIQYMDVLFICYWFAWVSCYSRRVFFIGVFFTFIKTPLFNYALFGLCFCYLILTFCWCGMNIFIYFNILLSSW